MLGSVIMSNCQIPLSFIVKLNDGCLDNVFVCYYYVLNCPLNVTFSLGWRVRLAKRPRQRLLQVGHHTSSNTFHRRHLRLWGPGLRLHPGGLRLHPKCDHRLFRVLRHQQLKRWYFRRGLWRRLMSNHAEMCAVRHGDGYGTHWWGVGPHREEGRLQETGNGTMRILT